MCGAPLREPRKRLLGRPQGDLWLLLLVVATIVALWSWKPWQTRGAEPTPLVVAAPTSTSSPAPVDTYAVAPTATPLHSPTPPPTLTLPPNQTRHTVQSGETASTIAKEYGTTVKVVLAANGLTERSVLSVGQELIIPLPVAQTSTPTPTFTPSPTPFLYTLRTGDTLSAIANRFNTTVEALMEANGIEDATRLRVGTQITIVQPPDYAAVMAYETYEVQQGDTLFTLSARYGVPIAEIRKVNDLQNDNLRVGQQLRIPVGTATPTPTLTPAPTLTPTPGPPRPAPMLLAPADGAAFDGAGTVILLNWASVGILDQDEWYVVRLRRVGSSTNQPALAWVKATSWRVPLELYVAGLAAPQRFRWEVTVMRQTGAAEDGAWLGTATSPSSAGRTFSWK